MIIEGKKTVGRTFTFDLTWRAYLGLGSFGSSHWHYWDFVLMPEPYIHVLATIMMYSCFISDFVCSFLNDALCCHWPQTQNIGENLFAWTIRYTHFFSNLSNSMVIKNFFLNFCDWSSGPPHSIIIFYWFSAILKAFTPTVSLDSPNDFAKFLLRHST